MPLPSPASTIESLTRELEHSLDINSAIRGQFVVKPQVCFVCRFCILFFTVTTFNVFSG